MQESFALRPCFLRTSSTPLSGVVIGQIDTCLRSLFSVGVPQRPYPFKASKAAFVNQSVTESVTEYVVEPLTEFTTHPTIKLDALALSDSAKTHAAGLMRINHVGEICAQALYAGQALSAKTIAVKNFNHHAALEERDHLLWTAQRLQELNARPSVLNPFWYVGAWGLGLVAGLLGDKISLSFVQETEAQVEAHLHRHETLLPDSDVVSRAIVAQMKVDEAAHGAQAQALGAQSLPKPFRLAMQACALGMTKTAYYI